MTWKPTPTEAGGATTRDPDLPPAPRSWPHIARRGRSSTATDHPARPLPAWPRRPTAQPPRDIHRGHGAGRCAGRERGTATVAVAVDDSGARKDREPGRTAGRHRASPPARSGEHAASGTCPGPSDLARRARRYERRMTHRPAGSRAADHTETGSWQLDGAHGSQRTTPIRTTRFPSIRPDSIPFPGSAPAPHAPDRHLRRSPGRNPIRRPDPDGRRLFSDTPRRPPDRRGPTVRRRRPADLIGAALTTVFIAVPLGPGPTATAYTGGATVVAHPGSEGGPTIAVRAISGSVTPQTEDGPAPVRGRNSSLSAEVSDAHFLAARTAGGAAESAAVSPTATPVHVLSGPPVDATTGPAEPATGQSNEVARRSPAGSSRAGSCGTGSNSGSTTGSGVVCRALPLLEDLVHELLRRAPRPVSPACPCPDRGR